MRLVLLGPPGAGKGTQAHRLEEHFEVVLIGTGDIFRENVKGDTPLGRKAKAYLEEGDLVPDDIVVLMVLDRLEQPDTDRGFILDGFPRTLSQAQSLEEALSEQDRPLSAALKFVVSDEVAVKRLAGRRTCNTCGRTYNVEFKRSVVEDVCDRCGDELMQRRDDLEATVRHRLEVYHHDTEPLEFFFWERGLLREVDAEGSEDVVTERAADALADLTERA
jgi:adenylate kinase